MKIGGFEEAEQELQAAQGFATKAQSQPIYLATPGNADEFRARKLLGLESAGTQIDGHNISSANNVQQPSTGNADNPKADAKKWQSLIDQAVSLIGQNQLIDAQDHLYEAMQVYPDNEAYMNGCELYIKLYVLEKNPQLADSCAVDAMNRAQRLGQNGWADKMRKWHQSFQSMLGDADGQPDSNAGADIVHRSLSQQLQDLKFYQLPHRHSLAGFQKLLDASNTQPQPNAQQWQDLIDKANNLMDRKQFDDAEQALEQAMPLCPDDESNNKTMLAFIKLYELRGDPGTADAYAKDAQKGQEKLGNAQWANVFANAHQRLQQEMRRQ